MRFFYFVFYFLKKTREKRSCHVYHSHPHNSQAHTGPHTLSLSTPHHLILCDSKCKYATQKKSTETAQILFCFTLHRKSETTNEDQLFFFINGRGFNGGHRPSGKARAETLNIHGCRSCVAWALLRPERRRSWVREGFPLPDLHADYKRCLPHSMWSQLLLHVHHHSPP